MISDKMTAIKKIFKLTHRVAVFFTVFQCVPFVLFLAGNRNLFLDTTLIGLLELNTAVSVWLMVIIAVYLVELLILFLAGRRRQWLWYLCFALPSLASAIAFSFVTRLLVRLAMGAGD